MTSSAKSMACILKVAAALMVLGAPWVCWENHVLRASPASALLRVELVAADIGVACLFYLFAWLVSGRPRPRRYSPRLGRVIAYAIFSLYLVPDVMLLLGYGPWAYMHLGWPALGVMSLAPFTFYAEEQRMERAHAWINQS